MRQIPLRDFFKNPTAAQFDLSPSGKQLAFLAPAQSRMNVFVRPADNPEAAKQISDVRDRDIAGFAWKGDNHILFMRDFGGDENFQLFSINIHSGEETPLTPFEGVRTQTISWLKDDPTHILVGLNKRNPQIFDPYRLNVETGELTLLAENPGNITSWMTDNDGILRIAAATDGVNTTLLYRDDEAAEFEAVLTTDFKENLSPLFFTYDNPQHAYCTSNLGRDKAAIIRYDLKAKKELDIIFEHDEVDVTSLGRSRKRKVITTVSYTTWRNQRHYLDATVEQLFSNLEAHFPGKDVTITSMNDDEDLCIAKTYGDKTRGAYYLYDVKADTIAHIADVSPWIKEDEMANMKPIVYISRDGLKINGYLTLPKNYSEGKLPVIVHPHGGPWARDHWGFNPMVQLLANRGYAVLQMNFRGSTGYGRQFWEASFKQWGLAMQDDVTDGVNWLIEQGIADPDRIAIYGGSYGGYTTLAGITFTPDLYACAVDYVGVSNLFTFMETIPPYWKPYLDMLYEMVGDPNDPEDKKRLHATSPVFHVDQIKVPLLIAQGAKDPRVNQDESDQVVAALRERGIEVEYILKENEGHGFSNEENRFELYEAMERFFAEHLK